MHIEVKIETSKEKYSPIIGRGNLELETDIVDVEALCDTINSMVIGAIHKATPEEPLKQEEEQEEKPSTTSTVPDAP